MHGAIVVSKSIASADCFNKGSLISCPHTNEIYLDQYPLNTVQAHFSIKVSLERADQIRMAGSQELVGAGIRKS